MDSDSKCFDGSGGVKVGPRHAAIDDAFEVAYLQWRRTTIHAFGLCDIACGVVRYACDTLWRFVERVSVV